MPSYFIYCTLFLNTKINEISICLISCFCDYLFISSYVMSYLDNQLIIFIVYGSSICAKCIKVKLPVQTSKYLAAEPDRGTIVVTKSKLLLTAAQGTYSSSFARYLVMFRGTVYLRYPPLENKNNTRR